MSKAGSTLFNTHHHGSLLELPTVGGAVQSSGIAKAKDYFCPCLFAKDYEYLERRCAANIASRVPLPAHRGLANSEFACSNCSTRARLYLER